MKPLTKSFFKNKTTLEIARLLLGTYIEYEVDGVIVGGIINETEVYTQDDEASHSYNGKTARNASMFAPAGTVYVYTSYGIHLCMNIVTAEAGCGEAVLLRSIIPTKGIEKMQDLRKRKKDIANGPGKLTQALGITKVLDGTDIFSGPVRIFDIGKNNIEIKSSPRIGISKAKDRLWRFYFEE